MRPWVKRLWWGVVLAAGAALLVWAFIPTPVDVDVAEVRRGPLEVTVDQDGRTRVRERYVIAAPLAGMLRRVPHKAGDPVEAGATVLLSIEPTLPTLLDARAREEAEARVRAAEAAIQQAEPAIERADYELQQAQVELRRITDLAARNAASQYELETAQLRVSAERANLAAMRSARDIAVFQLQQAQAALRHLVEVSVDPEAQAAADVVVHSPVTGWVLRVERESAGPVNAGQTILEVGDATDLEAVIDVLSRDGVAIRPGAAVRLERWGGARPLRGVVRLVEPSGFTKISALGVEEQRVNVIVDFVDPLDARETLRDGFRVDARIVVWEADDVLKIPTAALLREGADWATFVVRDGRATRQRITVGQMNGQEAQVLEGLREGDVVIIHAGDELREGGRVHWRRWDSPRIP